MLLQESAKLAVSLKKVAEANAVSGSTDICMYRSVHHYEAEVIALPTSLHFCFICFSVVE